MKREHFGSEAPLHAASLRSIETTQAAAIGQFFETNHFIRFALTVANTVDNPEGYDPADLLCGLLLQRIADMANLTQPTDVFIILESPQRLNPKLLGALAGSTLSDGVHGKRIHVNHMSKEANLPLLEESDFVIHTAGAQLRCRLEGRPFPHRKDYDSVFWAVPQQFVMMNELLGARGRTSPSTS